MKSEVERPSLWDIRRELLSSVDFAEDFALSHPEHADAVARFSQELRRLKRELMSHFKSSFTPAPLHDIVNGLTGARAVASFMAERHPEKSGPLSRFEDGVKHAQVEFIRKVRPEVYRQT
jgi:hypothetical protein